MLLFGKKPLLILYPTRTGRPPHLLPLNTNTSQHQAVNRYWHMKHFSLIDLYLHLACFKFNLQRSLILVAIKYATYPAISTWQHLKVQISFCETHGAFPTCTCLLGYHTGARNHLCTHSASCSLPFISLANLLYLQSSARRSLPLPSLSWPWDLLCNWPHPFLEQHFKQSPYDTFFASIYFWLCLSPFRI